MKRVSGSVRILKCLSCAAKFPIFDYELESDAEAIGLYSAGSCKETSLLLFELNPTEWDDARTGNLLHVPDKLLKDTSIGNDYRLTHILRVDSPPPPPEGLSFSEFRKHYQAPTVVYACPCCGSGEAISTSEVTAQEFVESGGNIHALGDIAVVLQ